MLVFFFSGEFCIWLGDINGVLIKMPKYVDGRIGVLGVQNAGTHSWFLGL